MPSYTMVVLTNAKDGRDDEFNDWYSNRHIQDILAIDGFVSAERFRLAASQRGTTPSPYKYLALYQIETSDLAGTLAELGARSGTEKAPISDAMDLQRFAYVYEVIK